MKDLKLTATLRARAYVRVSSVSKERAETLLSDEMQIDEARRYAEYLGFDFQEHESRINADLDVSGFRLDWRKRPGLMRLLEAAKRGEFEVLIFFKLSRLSRRVRHALEIIDEFERYGVSFHFVSEKIDGSSSQGRFLRNVLLSAAEMQAEDISDFVKATQRRAAMSGKPHGAQPGWIGRLADGKYELIDERVRAMRRLIELRIAGLGQITIARTLNSEGHRTSEGGFWTQSQIHKYLREDWIKSMRGTAFYGRRREDVIEIANAYPAIISEEEAERLGLIQKLYRELYDKGGRKPKGMGRTHAGSRILSGFLFCPYCGASMHLSSANDNKQRKGEKVIRYVCPRRLTQRSVHPMNVGSIISYSIEDAVLRVVREALAWPPAPVYEERPNTPPPSLDKQLTEVQARIDKLVEMNLRGRLSDEDFSRHYDSLSQEKVKLQAAKYESEEPNFIKMAKSLEQKENLSREELRQLVMIVVERVEANVTVPGNKIRSNVQNPVRYARVTLRFPTSKGQRVFLSRLHRASYEGEKEIIACDAPLSIGVIQIPPAQN